MRTYVLKTNFSGQGTSVRHVFLRPGRPAGRDVRGRVGPARPAAASTWPRWPRAWAGRGCRRSTARRWSPARPRRSTFDVRLPAPAAAGPRAGDGRRRPGDLPRLGASGGRRRRRRSWSARSPGRSAGRRSPVDLAAHAGKQVALTPLARRREARDHRLLGQPGGAQPGRAAAGGRRPGRRRAAPGRDPHLGRHAAARPPGRLRLPAADEPRASTSSRGRARSSATASARPPGRRWPRPRS